MPLKERCWFSLGIWTSWKTPIRYELDVKTEFFLQTFFFLGKGCGWRFFCAILYNQGSNLCDTNLVEFRSLPVFLTKTKAVTERKSRAKKVSYSHEKPTFWQPLQIVAWLSWSKFGKLVVPRGHSDYHKRINAPESGLWSQFRWNSFPI